VIFQGEPQVTLTPVFAPGSPLDNPVGRALLRTQLDAEERNLEEEFSDFDLYPVLAFGVSYRFWPQGSSPQRVSRKTALQKQLAGAPGGRRCGVAGRSLESCSCSQSSPGRQRPKARRRRRSSTRRRAPTRRR